MRHVLGWGWLCWVGVGIAGPVAADLPPARQVADLRSGSVETTGGLRLLDLESVGSTG